MTTVSVYDLNGWVEDLPYLNIGRRHHACSSFLNADGAKVFYTWTASAEKIDINVLFYVLQILLVTGGNGETGGGSNLIDSTEIYNTLVMGSWNIAQAALPRPMNGLRATNIDNMVLIFVKMNFIFLIIF